MKINFDQEITKDDGSSIVSEKKSFNVKKNEEGQWVAEPNVDYKDKTLLSDVCQGALTDTLAKVSVAETMKRFKLKNKIANGGEVELDEAELADLKELVNNKYDLMMAGKILLMLGEE
ncbi:MAG TPA: hypothetical protein PKK32_00840 [Candidatus Paceibacterota bacterium]|nr:hypothetical protein [Candidatus Paceibacterota bacterium]